MKTNLFNFKKLKEDILIISSNGNYFPISVTLYLSDIVKRIVYNIIQDQNK